MATTDPDDAPPMKAPDIDDVRRRGSRPAFDYSSLLIVTVPELGAPIV